MAGHPVKVSLLTGISHRPSPNVFPANGLTGFILCVFLCVLRVLVVVILHKECDTCNCDRLGVLDMRTLSLDLEWV